MAEARIIRYMSKYVYVCIYTYIYVCVHTERGAMRM